MRSDLTRPYDWVNNPPDPNSLDTKNVMAWMTAHGAPSFQFFYLGLVQPGAGEPLPGAVYPPGFWVVQFTGMSYPCDLALTLNSPDSTLQTISNVMGLGLNVPPYTPPVTPPTPPVNPPTPQPSDPVGVPEDPKNTGVGAYFALAAGDTLPVGSLFPNPPVSGQPLYQKTLQKTPFGQWIFWQRIA